MNVMLGWDFKRKTLIYLLDDWWMSFPGGCWCHHRRDNLQYLLLLRLGLALRVTRADHVDSGADGGVPLLVNMDGPDLHEDVREDLDVQVVRHHAQDQPVPEVEDVLQILRSLVRNAGRNQSYNNNTQLYIIRSTDLGANARRWSILALGLRMVTSLNTR